MHQKYISLHLIGHFCKQHGHFALLCCLVMGTQGTCPNVQVRLRRLLGSYTCAKVLNSETLLIYDNNFGINLPGTYYT